MSDESPPEAPTIDFQSPRTPPASTPDPTPPQSPTGPAFNPFEPQLPTRRHHNIRRRGPAPTTMQFGEMGGEPLLIEPSEARGSESEFDEAPATRYHAALRARTGIPIVRKPTFNLEGPPDGEIVELDGEVTAITIKEEAAAVG